MLHFKHEKMSWELEKQHIIGLPFNAVIHHITGADKGNPHDHPWGFTTHILKGGYIERVYHIRENGTWYSEIIHRKPNSVYAIEATHIHEIIELPEGECWTLVMPKPVERESCFWQFIEKNIAFRKWHETEFTPF